MLRAIASRAASGRRAFALPKSALVVALATLAFTASPADSAPSAAPVARTGARPASGVAGVVGASAGNASAGNGGAPPTSHSPASALARRLDEEARAPATDVRIAPSMRGMLGAWLVAGPFRAARSSALEAAPPGVDEASLLARPFASAPAPAAVGEKPSSGADAPRKANGRWFVASSAEGPIDLKSALGPASDAIAYAAGTLHVETDGRYTLLLGVDDGVRVIVDGRAVLTRDVGRPVREDDDVIPLELGAGDHPIVLKLHQREGAWAFRARIVDATLAPAQGAYLQLAGTTADDARALAARMSIVSLDRAFDAKAASPTYRPQLTVRFSEGAPRGVPLSVSTRLVPAAGEPLFDVQAGGVPLSGRGVGELVVSLPPVAPFTGSFTLETNVAGRVVRSAFPSRPIAEQALVRAERALAAVPADASLLAEGSIESVRYLTQRLARLVNRGDGDTEAQTEEARELDRLAASLEQGVDPYETRTGPMRRALRSPIDGQLSEHGLYVPPWYKPNGTRKFPLVVGLHGLNGSAMGILRWMFGGDDPKHDQTWEDRHVGALSPIDAFVVTPFAHGNSLYRELGETDVMNVVAWAMRRYPIDPARVSITGPSMGGIGSAAIPLHRPHVFAAAAPLCGYHSVFVRSDVGGRGMRPWEKYFAEERSNVFWAENGEHLPLWIVHGTQDLPEENSGVLIDRYEALRYSVKHDHPEAGHNVWQQTYDELRGLTWLINRRVDLRPSHVRFKTSRTRWAKSAWVTVDELASEQAWGEIDARVDKKARSIIARTSGIAQLTLTKEDVPFAALSESEGLPAAGAAINIAIDGQKLVFDDGEPLVLARGPATRTGAWRKGALAHAKPFKHGTITGPIRDVFAEPILFVYGADENEARANEQVARAFAKIRAGVHVSYPVMSDTEFLAAGEPLANDRALFLVGRSNKVLAALDRLKPFPIRVDASAVMVGTSRFTGRELGAAFVHPNPAKSDRYVVVVAGADIAGTLRATSLPDLLPDFIVWDEGLAPARGQILLGGGSARAAGLFTKEWDLPLTITDPLSRGRGRAEPPPSAPAAAAPQESALPSSEP